MKVKVTRKFIDKHTGVLYHRGDVIDITEERYAEIIGVGNFVFRIAQNDAESVSDNDANTLSDETAETPTNDSEKSGDGFDIMSVRELKEYADAAHKLTFKSGTKKAEIIETLRRIKNGK